MSAPAPSAPMLPTPMLRYTARGVPVHCVMMCDLITLDSGTLYDSLGSCVLSCDCESTGGGHCSVSSLSQWSCDNSTATG